MYSRLAYIAIIKETVPGTVIKPTVFIPVTKFEATTQYQSNPSTPIIANRTKNINPIKNLIEAPEGKLSMEVEPLTFGHFLRGIYGAVISGRYFPISSVTGAFAVGDVVTGTTSSATATILAVSSENDYLIMGAPTGTFTAAGEAITAPVGKSATLGVNAGTVYGHEAKAPQTSLPTFTLEVGLENEAYRFGGVTFHDFASIAHSDNIITAEVALRALFEFKHARVTAVTTAGSTKTISVDQTMGLTTADSIKIFRPSTGAFIDLNGAGVKFEAIASIPGETSFTIATLTDATAVGDLVMLNPQTPSYSLANEFSWIGGSVARTADTLTLAIAASAALSGVEEFEFSLENEMESRHAANGVNLINRFPVKNHLKKLSGEGKLKKAYLDQTFLDRSRNGTSTALQIRSTADLIAATNMNYLLDWRVPALIFKPFNPALGEDALLEQDMAFELYRSSAAGFTSKALLVNTVASY